MITTLHQFNDPESGALMTNETKHVLSLESPTSLAVETTRVGALGGCLDDENGVRQELTLRPLADRKSVV